MNHYEDDWGTGCYDSESDSFVEAEPKQNFSPFLTQKMTILVKVSAPIKFNYQYTMHSMLINPVHVLEKETVYMKNNMME